MRDNRFIILMYHMISTPQSESEKKYACPPELFDKHMRFIGKNYNAITLDEISAHLYKKQPLSKNSVAITLDDGFADNFDHGYPILAKYKIPATVFLTTGQLGKKNLWMSCRDFPERQLLSWNQVKKMHSHGLIQFGAHTVNHVSLPEVDQDTAHREITDSKSIIEDNLGVQVRHFAYPFGSFNNQIAAMVEKAGYDSACSTRPGFNNYSSDPFSLKRIEIFGYDPLWKVRQKLLFGTNEASVFLPMKYYASRVINRFNRNLEIGKDEN